MVWYAPPTLDTSVVILVTKLDAWNLSILENENYVIFSYISCLKFFAKPADALLQK
jgi:hypothetical protein